MDNSADKQLAHASGVAGNEPPPWFWNVILEGLQRLVVLRLDYAPPADAIELTAAAWVSALAAVGSDGAYAIWHEALDAPRLAEGFRILGAHRTSWPKPANLLAAMPERPRPALSEPAPPLCGAFTRPGEGLAPVPPALPPPPETERQAALRTARNRGRLRNMLERIGRPPITPELREEAEHWVKKLLGGKKKSRRSSKP